jgi:hypothetical protein
MRVLPTLPFTLYRYADMLLNRAVFSLAYWTYGKEESSAEFAKEAQLISSYVYKRAQYAMVLYRCFLKYLIVIFLTF